MSSYGNVALRFASYNGYNEVAQFFLSNTAWRVLKNTSSQPALDFQSEVDEIRNLLTQTMNSPNSEQKIPENDHIEWSLSGDNLINKAKEFRQQIDLYKTYSNHHHLITKLLIEIIEYYLKEYLVEQEKVSKNEINKLEFYFKQGIEQNNYLIYFIKAYTLTNSFHRILNKHLALYILHYFDSQAYSSLKSKYRLINCLAHIVTLLTNHPDIHKYRYTGITYRGLLIKKDDLECYSIGNHILNRSFVSTSKDRSIAKLFAGSEHLGNISDYRDLEEIPVLLKYTTKQSQTSIDIEEISMIPSEEEVLILPFSVFQVKDRNENCRNVFSPMLVEIDLEECQDNDQINNEIQDSEPTVGLQDKIKKRTNVIFIGLCIVVALFVALGLFVKAQVQSGNRNIQTKPKELAEMQLDRLWEDEFNSEGTVDQNKWDFDVGGNGWNHHEKQYYTQNRAQNARCENFPGSQNGRLIIEAHKETYDKNNFTSARLKSKKSWTYGRLQVRALLPKGRGLYSVFLLFPVNKTYGREYWPDNGNIDLMLHHGNDPQNVEAAINTKSYNWLVDNQPINKVTIPDVTTDFKVYTLEWNVHQLEMFVGDDDDPFKTRILFWPKLGGDWTRWPFDKPFYVLLFLAIGGIWGGNDIDDSIFPCRMEIDWIRYYQQPSI
ncbi:unnamed protein product [Adineta ricciae]|nr:unnamed protein product [Adineta ricciae]